MGVGTWMLQEHAPRHALSLASLHPHPPPAVRSGQHPLRPRDHREGVRRGRLGVASGVHLILRSAGRGLHLTLAVEHLWVSTTDT
eukprot:257297-Rhodomonas_salina.1